MKKEVNRYKVEIPKLVQQANSLTQELGFPLLPDGRALGYQGPPSACIPEVGKLLSVLAAGYPNGKIGEFGTGAGVGTAWLIQGLRRSDSRRAVAAGRGGFGGCQTGICLSKSQADRDRGQNDGHSGGDPCNPGLLNPYGESKEELRSLL